MKGRLLFAAALTMVVASAAPSFAQTILLTNPSDPIVGVGATPGSATSTASTVGTVAGQNNYPAAEAPPNAIDGRFAPPPAVPAATKYLNFAETNVGLIVTPSVSGILNAVSLVAANDAPERDPVQISIEGTNDPNATTTLNSNWASIYAGVSGLATDPGRFTVGQEISFPNTTSYLSYRFLVTQVRNGATANSMQFGELNLLSSPVPEPSSMALAGLGLGLIVRRRFKKRVAG